MSSANAASSQGPMVATGTFTSAESAAAEVITIGFNPRYMEVHMDQEGVPDKMSSFNGATSSTSTTGADGITTSPANEIVYNGDGTVTVAIGLQTDDGVNWWFALR